MVDFSQMFFLDKSVKNFPFYAKTPNIKQTF